MDRRLGHENRVGQLLLAYAAFQPQRLEVFDHLPTSRYPKFNNVRE